MEGACVWSLKGMEGKWVWRGQGQGGDMGTEGTWIWKGYGYGRGMGMEGTSAWMGTWV